eukprot:TRINITY_DN1924_c0_g1_i1.p1 TRINITY_DN1924_c0_g1~~TRINITY_DN1924_c0_g1_i1.p1  ORF type:complete len:1024 (-),score=309.42 TRINITY_DN1924_c0_g1_i1:26-3097(-)
MPAISDQLFSTICRVKENINQQNLDNNINETITCDEENNIITLFNPNSFITRDINSFPPYRYIFDDVFHNSDNEKIYEFNLFKTIERFLNDENGSIILIGPKNTDKSSILTGDEYNPGICEIAIRRILEELNYMNEEDVETKLFCSFSILVNGRMIDLLNGEYVNLCDTSDYGISTSASTIEINTVPQFLRHMIHAFRRIKPIIVSYLTDYYPKQDLPNYTDIAHHLIVNFHIMETFNEEISLSTPSLKINSELLGTSKIPFIHDLKRSKKIHRRSLSFVETCSALEKDYWNANSDAASSAKTDLNALEAVFRAISERVNEHSHVPFRNSLLTLLLRDSLLSGNTTLVSTVSCAIPQYNFALSTLQRFMRLRMLLGKTKEDGELLISLSLQYPQGFAPEIQMSTKFLSTFSSPLHITGFENGTTDYQHVRDFGKSSFSNVNIDDVKENDRSVKFDLSKNVEITETKDYLFSKENQRGQNQNVVLPENESKETLYFNEQQSKQTSKNSTFQPATSVQTFEKPQDMMTEKIEFGHTKPSKKQIETDNQQEMKEKRQIQTKNKFANQKPLEQRAVEQSYFNEWEKDEVDQIITKSDNFFDFESSRVKDSVDEPFESLTDKNNEKKKFSSENFYGQRNEPHKTSFNDNQPYHRIVDATIPFYNDEKANVKNNTVLNDSNDQKNGINHQHDETSIKNAKKGYNVHNHSNPSTSSLLPEPELENISSQSQSHIDATLYDIHKLRENASKQAERLKLLSPGKESRKSSFSETVPDYYDKDSTSHISRTINKTVDTSNEKKRVKISDRKMISEGFQASNDNSSVKTSKMNFSTVRSPIKTHLDSVIEAAKMREKVAKLLAKISELENENEILRQEKIQELEEKKNLKLLLQQRESKLHKLLEQKLSLEESLQITNHQLLHNKKAIQTLNEQSQKLSSHLTAGASPLNQSLQKQLTQVKKELDNEIFKNKQLNNELHYLSKENISLQTELETFKKIYDELVQHSDNTRQKFLEFAYNTKNNCSNIFFNENEV